MRKQKNLKLEEEAIDYLLELSEKLELSQSQVIELAIQKLAASYPKASRELADETPSGPSQIAFEKTLGVLERQLAAKDEQIADYSARLADATQALRDAQESVKAAQTLHAIDRKEDVLAIESAEQKKSRWERLKAAWRG